MHDKLSDKFHKNAALRHRMPYPSKGGRENPLPHRKPFLQLWIKYSWGIPYRSLSLHHCYYTIQLSSYHRRPDWQLWQLPPTSTTTLISILFLIKLLKLCLQLQTQIINEIYTLNNLHIQRQTNEHNIPTRHHFQQSPVTCIKNCSKTTGNLNGKSCYVHKP